MTLWKVTAIFSARPTTIVNQLKDRQSLGYRQFRDFENVRRTGSYDFVTGCDAAGRVSVGAKQNPGRRWSPA